MARAWTSRADAAETELNILTFSTLFPSAGRPAHGIFVKTRLRRLLADSDLQAKVIAPVPWYPRGLRWPARYAEFAETEAVEQQDELTVFHPRYLLIPKFGMSIAPYLLKAGSIGPIRRLIAGGFRIDLIDAHYFYPDGVAAAMIGKALRIPVTITARGTDINLIPRYRIPRALILRAARDASGILTVCAALRDELIKLGAEPEKIVVARNGVDLELFTPAADRGALRKALGMSGPSVCSVGHLIQRKGHDLCVRALVELQDVTLYIIGDGPEKSALEKLARELQVSERVRFVGRVGQKDLRRYYCAADALMLASDREGWANVLLEAMACGTPVVATAIWGTPEVVASPAAGELVAERTPACLAAGVRRLLERKPDRASTRRYAEGFSWDQTSALQLQVFRQAMEGSQR